MAAALVLVTAAALAPAVTRAQFTVRGDVEAGRRAAQVCVPCHGPRGVSTRPDAPSLAGQVPLYTYLQLYQFREGRRRNPEMAPFIAALSDQAMQDVAAYFAAESTPPSRETFDPERAARGRAVSNRHACEGCHRPEFTGHGHVPRLTGLTREYVVTQLHGYKAQTRADYDGFMTGAAQPLAEQDIEDLAHYIVAVASGQPVPARIP